MKFIFHTFFLVLISLLCSESISAQNLEFRFRLKNLFLYDSELQLNSLENELFTSPETKRSTNSFSFDFSFFKKIGNKNNKLLFRFEFGQFKTESKLKRVGDSIYSKFNSNTSHFDLGGSMGLIFPVFNYNNFLFETGPSFFISTTKNKKFLANSENFDSMDSLIDGGKLTVDLPNSISTGLSNEVTLLKKIKHIGFGVSADFKFLLMYEKGTTSELTQIYNERREIISSEEIFSDEKKLRLTKVFNSAIVVSYFFN